MTSTHKGPGKADREGITLLQIAQKFGTEEAAYKWLASVRWPKGAFCPDCGSKNVQDNIQHKTMTHRCRDCPSKPFFSLRKGTVMEGTKLPYQLWAIGLYLFTTNLKGISSMKLHRELGIRQSSAWFMLHRLRQAAQKGEGSKGFSGPVEVDETYVGGKRENMSRKRRKAMAKLGRGPAGKAVVLGAKDRATGQVTARVAPNSTRKTLHGFVAKTADKDATVYTDEFPAYEGLPFAHEAVKHKVGEYVRGRAHTQGIESFWSMLKRAHTGTYHKMSHKHLDRYVGEFTERHNMRELDTVAQMQQVVKGMNGKRLRYADLIADNGLPSGARK